jgi:hypothetical protein
MSDSLELLTPLLCPHPARPELPSDVSGHTAIFANAPFPPVAKWTADRMMIGAFMPNDDSEVIQVAESMKNAGGLTDWLRARLDDSRLAERGIKPAPSPCSTQKLDGR